MRRPARRTRGPDLRSGPMDQQLAPRPHQDVLIRRRFDAPRALVFRAWTDPAMLARWWAPATSPTPSAAPIHVRAANSTLSCAHPTEAITR
ncbi:MAG: SRPBCC domain-containing protein [Sphingomonadales bacterium]